MNFDLGSALVLCDLDNLMLGADGFLAPAVREVLELFVGRGGRFTVFSQRSPRAVRAIMGDIALGAPALLCGGNLTYNFAQAAAKPLRSFSALGESFALRLPAEAGVGVALQMNDGTTRVLRMSRALEGRLRRESTPYLLGSAEDISGENVLRVMLCQDEKTTPLMQMLDKAIGDSLPHLRAERLSSDTVVLTPGAASGSAMLEAVCLPVMLPQESVLVAAGGLPMLDIVRASTQSVAAADSPAALRGAAKTLTLTDCGCGAAAEIFYGLVRAAENGQMSFDDFVGKN